MNIFINKLFFHKFYFHRINRQIRSSKILMRRFVYNIKLLNQAANRQYLNFKIQCDDINDETLENIKQDVESLEFFGSSSSINLQNSIDSRMNSFENLRKLSLKNINFGSEEKSSIEWNLKSLTFLRIEGSWNIRFNLKFNQLRTLENIELINIQENIDCDELRCFLEIQSNLKEISLSLLKINFNENSTFKPWKINNLRSLRLRETDARLFHVIKNIKSLEKLFIIQECDWKSSEVVGFIQQQLNLKDLSIFDLSRDYYETIIPFDGKFPLEKLILFSECYYPRRCYELIENCKSTLKNLLLIGNFCRFTKRCEMAFRYGKLRESILKARIKYDKDPYNDEKARNKLAKLINNDLDSLYLS
jgi:hypothetical protein